MFVSGNSYPPHPWRPHYLFATDRPIDLPACLSAAADTQTKTQNMIAGHTRNCDGGGSGGPGDCADRSYKKISRKFRCRAGNVPFHIIWRHSYSKLVFFCNLTAKLNLSFFKIPFSSYFSGRETVATFAASAIIPLPVPLICIIECRSLPLYLPPQLHKRSQRYRNSGWMMY